MAGLTRRETIGLAALAAVMLVGGLVWLWAALPGEPAADPWPTICRDGQVVMPEDLDRVREPYEQGYG
jgi:hypothetical protein